MGNKICPNCNKINSDDNYYCTECGANLIKTPTQNQPHKQSNTLNQDKTSGWDILGLLVGITLIVVGIVIILSVDDIKFGADFYTEIYKLVAICTRSILGILTAAGVTIFIVFANRLKKHR